MKKVGLALAIVFIISLAMFGISLAEMVVIEGTVNDEYQIVTDDNQVYEIGFSEQSDKLAEEVNKKVRAKGEVETGEDNTKTINVSSYEVIAAKSGE